jgi:hypothetical protein
LERRESVRPSLQDLNHGLPITLAPSSKKRKEERRREEKRREESGQHTYIVL